MTLLERIIREEIGLRDVELIEDTVNDLIKYISSGGRVDLRRDRTFIINAIENTPTSPSFKRQKDSLIDGFEGARHPGDLLGFLRAVMNDILRKKNVLDGGANELPTRRSEPSQADHNTSTLRRFISDLPKDLDSAKKMASDYVRQSKIRQQNKFEILTKIDQITNYDKLVSYLWSSLLAREVGRVI